MRVQLTQRWRGLPEGSYDAKPTKYGIGLFSTGPRLPFQPDKPLLNLNWADYNWAIARGLINTDAHDPVKQITEPLGATPVVARMTTQIRVTPTAINVYQMKNDGQMALVEQRSARTIA